MNRGLNPSFERSAISEEFAEPFSDASPDESSGELAGELAGELVGRCQANKSASGLALLIIYAQVYDL